MRYVDGAAVDILVCVCAAADDIVPLRAAINYFHVLAVVASDEVASAYLAVACSRRLQLAQLSARCCSQRVHSP